MLVFNIILYAEFFTRKQPEIDKTFSTTKSDQLEKFINVHRNTPSTHSESITSNSDDAELDKWI